ncbi:DegT/DnrJ/EryC1/StrS family aminotransferase [Oceanibaculum nanhaiense]|uniref:DegT/DnrJ/EryC1/StrS family aminotransferase n=1 Tax=Oceanibaculum nanhaiense TaxID=1909734 RepID=UPI003F6F74BA
MIPQTDPKAAYHERKAEIDAAISRVLESGRYILGPEVEAFEQEFAAYAGVRHAVAVASGTDALILALRALGVGPGDAVITVSHTAVATVAAVELVGAMPVLVDVDACHGLDPEKLAATLAAWPAGAPKPKAIIPVHLYGQPAAMIEIMAIADRHGLAVLEDNSQAHGATLDGRMVGRFGRIAAYSLYPTKNLGAIGDGGIVATDDPDLTTALKELREYGWRERYVSAIAGMNSRLDPMQAAILRVKLAHLPADTARRRAIASAYDKGLAGIEGLRLPLTRPGAVPVYHQYVVEAPGRRDALQAALRERGVGTLVHYPVPVHLQPAYKGRVPLGAGGLPRTEAAALAVLSLPMFPQLADAQMEQVIAAIRDAWRQAA